MIERDGELAGAGQDDDRLISVLTTGRQDWGILRSTCIALRATPGLRLRLVAGGMHLSERHGSTVELLTADGFEPDARLAWIDERAGSDPSDTAPAQAAGALAAVAADLATSRPAALVLAGDRLETASAALAATLARVPIVHLHGGERTEGAFDDALRNAITKLSHLHLVSHPEHAARVIAMGEDPASVHVVGAPALDNLERDDLPDRAHLARELGLALDPPLVIVTVHPATLEADPAGLVDAVIAAMDAVPATYVVTLPNSDPLGAVIRERLVGASRAPDRVAVEALGERRYWGLLRIADAMLGNSSSGLIEAPAVDLPVVNVGDRQRGRRRGPNVIDTPANPAAVTSALRHALDPATRAALAAHRDGATDGRAGQRIARIIAGWTPPDPPRKSVPAEGAPEPVAVIGAGEHGRVVIDAIRSLPDRWELAGVVRASGPAAAHAAWPDLGDDAAFIDRLAATPPADRPALVLGIGAPLEPARRRAVVASYEPSARWATVVHPTAIVSRDASLADGVVVLAGAVVGPGASVGPHAVVNSGAVVEHDVALGAFAQVAPGAVIGGGATIGDDALIGLGARVRDHVTIGHGAVVGMGAVAVGDVAPRTTVVGIPARVATVTSAENP